MTPTSPLGSQAQSSIWTSRSQQVSGPALCVDLPFASALLRAEPAYAQEGHTARTLAKYRDLRVLLMAMRPGVRIALHETAERLAFQVLVGRLRLWLRAGGSEEVAEGAFLAVDSERAEAVECLEECAFTLTVAWPPDRAGDDDPIDL